MHQPCPQLEPAKPTLVNRGRITRNLQGLGTNPVRLDRLKCKEAQGRQAMLCALGAAGSGEVPLLLQSLGRRQRLPRRVGGQVLRYLAACVNCPTGSASAILTEVIRGCSWRGTSTRISGGDLDHGVQGRPAGLSGLALGRADRCLRLSKCGESLQGSVCRRSQ